METDVEDLKTRARFIELRAMNTSYSKITELLGVSKQTLINWAKQDASQIRNLRSIEREEILSKYALASEKRLELFAQKLDKVTEELDKRDFSDVETEKLMSLFFKLTDALSKDAVGVRFQEEISVPPAHLAIEKKIVSWTA